MRAFDFEMSRRGFASALAAGALSLALVGCGGGAAGAGSAAGSAATDGAGAAAEPVEVHVASLKGPTSIGLVQFMDQAADGETDNEFDFAINTAADEIVPKVIQGDIDIALVPANVASVLYNKTEGAVQVIGCVDGEDRYDGDTAPHGHFICRTCGSVIDLPPIPVELPDMTAVGEADSCGVVFYGRCNGCLAEKKTS